MTNLLVGDFIDFIFLKSFVVGIGILFLPATRADKALFHYHSPTMLYNLSFPFSLFCECFVIQFINKSFFVAYFIVSKFTIGCSLVVKSAVVKSAVVKSVAVSSCVLLAKPLAMVKYFYLAYFNPITSFWPTLAICLCVISRYYLLLVTYSLDESIPFSRVLFRIFTRIILVFSNFY